MHEPVAHSRNQSGKFHLLKDHLLSVATLASNFARKFSAGKLAFRAGLLHDLGKLHPAVQARLRGELSSSAEHRSTGAIVALQQKDNISPFIIAGHHAGIPDLGIVKELSPRFPLRPFELWLRQNLPSLPPPEYPPFAADKLSAEFLVRMLFSAVVDADFLDTEKHFSPDSSSLRSISADFEQLLSRLHSHIQTITSPSPIDQLRHSIYTASVRTATLPQGFFSLTAPTGAGKTLSSTAFALSHALVHSLHRIIIVIPYLNIIDQTADALRSLFGHSLIIEHHSALDPSSQDDRSQLSAENWDAPIIITTSVQFFESLHSNSPSTCRKLHNISRSVVILDEVQTLPPYLLNPILEAMRELVRNYSVTFLFSTATRPAFSSLDSIHEIVPDPALLFQKLKRVRYHHIPHPVDWEELASLIRQHPSVLVVLNTRRDARTLFNLLSSEPNIFYLTTELCPAHRRDVLTRIRDLLHRRAPCRLIATQLVEVGVDIDFPLVFRAVGPLDSIVQSAGRCNRNATLPYGDLIIFHPSEGSLPAGAYRTATDIAQSILSTSHPSQLHHPDIFYRYFEQLFNFTDTDHTDILSLRQHFLFQQVSSHFRLIPDTTQSVIVHYKNSSSLIDSIKRSPFLSRKTLRTLQLYTVCLRYHDFLTACDRALCRQIAGTNLFEWTGTYHPTLGLIMETPYNENLIF